MRTVLFLSTLLVLSICSRARLNSFGGILDKLVQLNQEIGTPLTDIAARINEIKNSQNDARESIERYHAAFESKFELTSQFSADFINKLKNAVLAAQARIDQAIKDNEKLENEQMKYGEQIEIAQQNLNEVEDQIKKALDTLKSIEIGAESKKAVIKVLLDIIQNELNSTEPSTNESKSSAGSSFIQLSKFNEKAHELKSLLRTDDSKYSPLLSTLLTLVEKQGLDHDVLKNTENVLNDLGADLEQFRQKQVNDQRNNIDTLKEKAIGYTEQLKILAGLLIANKNQMLDNKNAQDASKREIGSLNAEIERKTKEHEHYSKIWELHKNRKERLECQFRNANDNMEDLVSQMLDK
jgi:DNA repair exonuclease SbcCD ATPase subunit